MLVSNITLTSVSETTSPPTTASQPSSLGLSEGVVVPGGAPVKTEGVTAMEKKGKI